MLLSNNGTSLAVLILGFGNNPKSACKFREKLMFIKKVHKYQVEKKFEDIFMLNF